MRMVVKFITVKMMDNTATTAVQPTSNRICDRSRLAHTALICSGLKSVSGLTMPKPITIQKGVINPSNIARTPRKSMARI